MKLIKDFKNPLWTVAAQAGIFLSLVTLICSTADALIGNSFMSILFWIVKLTGSLWILRYFMRQWGEAHEGESTFNFGCAMCVCSSLICAVFTFVLYKYIVPDSLAKAFEMIETNLAATSELPEEMMDTIFRIEDNFPQICGIATMLWCSLLGVCFSGIFKNTTTCGNSIFTREEENNND